MNYQPKVAAFFSKKHWPLFLTFIIIFLSQVFTAIMNIINSLIWWGHIDLNLILIGCIDSLVVTLLISPMAIYLIRHSFNLEEMNRTLQKESRERQKIEEVLVQNEKRLLMITDNSRDVIWMLDMDFNFTFLSPSIEQMLGYTMEEYLGKSHQEIISPESYARLMEALSEELILENMPDKDVYRSRTIETEQAHKDGSKKWVELTMTFIRDSDRMPVGLLGFSRDITDKVAAREALKVSEELYQLLFNSINEVVYSIDLNYIITSISPSMEKYLGYKAEKYLGKPVYELKILPERYIEKSLSHISRVLQGETIESEEYEFFTKDGQIKFAEVSGAPIIRNGKVIGMISVARDITERKHAEEALKRSQMLLKSSIESQKDTILLFIDRNYRYLYYNKSHSDVMKYAYNKDVELGMNILECITSDEDRSAAKENYDRALMGESHTNIRVYGEVGISCYESFFNPILDDNNEIIGATALARDITDRKRTEDALRESNELLSLFMKHSPIYTFIKDVTPTESRVLMVSENYQDMIGVPSSEMVGRTMEDLFPAEFAAKITADDWYVVSCGKVIKQDEDLNGRSYNTVKFPIFHGGKNRLAGYTIDITDRKRAEDQVRHLQKSESLSRMAGAISHHFNNLLQVITGHIEMAIEDLPPESGVAENLAQAIQSSRKAAEVTSLMLAYLGQTPGKHELLDLSETCHLGLSVIRAVIPNKVVIESKFPQPGPIIWANTNQLQQVMANLVTNAWESIGDNPGTIELTVKTVSPANISTSHRFPADWQPQERAYACLEVADEGGGILERDIEKIFDPFFSTKFTGRGMGLSVVLGIVRALNGTVTVESDLNRGSIFRVFLPIMSEEILPEQEKTVPIPEFEGGGSVLLVEDEAMVCIMAKMMLTRLGYMVFEARDGVEAVEIFQKHQDKIRFVLSDLTMPRMDGWETLAALRKLSPDIPVILSSGYDEAQVMSGEHPERPNAFLGKPYQLKGLGDTIHLVLAEKNDNIVNAGIAEKAGQQRKDN